ncbi:Arf-GAP with GTPase, ANK repeat and PH domain-containing protein 2 [Hondaea fermentalgiana]|uniref:Arf-GAP with GTPase, ANK repeat and PH domain-containing protein 2 n=1 Tax=Hondaea fermentalgiana TaxID=2315210 RepID=A0A2R5GDT4_9STRA|nr:Arf-GAP with GTPase, ANK repeat and PH domain-containing protein 2 [Hondaea fermentalgiana]|eukprot:GBG29096.1 Arf-GAP with GTPase, ANK repeat and PH domain-containing protein 2 [Hondaea fermentalgiana]
MRAWVENGYLSSHIAIARSHDGPFAKLQAFYPEADLAFKTPPCAPTPAECVANPGTNEAMWYFKDVHGAIQGPFSGPQMNEWARNGLVTLGAEVRRGSGPSSRFVPRGDLYPDDYTAFFSSASAAASASASAAKHISQQHQRVTSKFFSRVGKNHRRSNSAGSSFSTLRSTGSAGATVDAQILASSLAGSNEYTEGADANTATPTPTSASSAATHVRKLAGKKLRSVVTPSTSSAASHTPRHTSQGLSEGDRGFSEGGSSPDTAVPPALPPTSHGAAMHHRRLKSLGKYGHRQFAKLKPKPRRANGRSNTRRHGSLTPDSINPHIVSAAGSSAADEEEPLSHLRGYSDDNILGHLDTSEEWPRDDADYGVGEGDDDDDDDDDEDEEDEDASGQIRGVLAQELESSSSLRDVRDSVETNLEAVRAALQAETQAEASRRHRRTNGSGDIGSEENDANHSDGDSDSESERDRDASFGYRSQRAGDLNAAAFPFAPVLNSDAVTDHVHMLLGTFRHKRGSSLGLRFGHTDHHHRPTGPSPTSSTSSMAGPPDSYYLINSGNNISGANASREKHIAALETSLAELQDENSQLKAYVRRMHSVVAAQHPSLIGHLVAPARSPPAELEPVSSGADHGGGPHASASPRPLVATPPPPQSSGSTAGTDRSRRNGGFPPQTQQQEQGGGDLVRQEQSKGSLSSSSNSFPEGDAALWEDFVVVEFDRDSPMLRRKLNAFGEGVEELRGELKDLIKSSYTYLENCQAELESLMGFADELNQPEIRKLSPLIHLYHELLKFVAQLRARMLHDLQGSLVFKFQDFLENDMKQAQSLRRELQRARDLYESLEAKYMHTQRPKGRAGVIGNVSRGHDGSESQLYGELQTAKARFELARFGLVQQINQLESKKRFVLVEHTAQAIDGLLAFFRQGYQALAAYSGVVEDARADIAGVQDKFDLIVGKWNEKRLQLESQLHSGAFPFKSTERRKRNMSKQHEKVVVSSSTSRASQDPLSVHEGYLYKRSSNVRRQWKRRYFVLRTDKLLYYRSWKDVNPQPVCDILLSSVREVANSEFKNCFEILSPNKKAYILQATSAHEMATWMAAMRRAIEMVLVKQQQRPSLSRTTGLADPDVTLLLKFNPTCADCGKADPDWVSLNLGVLICITCSGIHRSLGTHISKVRSLTLDQLARTQVRLLRRLGNEAMNTFMESTLSAEQKPDPDADRDTRERFIREKYVSLRFFDPAEISSHANEARARLFSSVRENDLDTLARVVLSGVLAGALDHTLDDAGDTALHVCAAAGHEDCVEFLVLNGADPAVVNDRGLTALQLAQDGGHPGAVALLERLLRSRSSSLASGHASSRGEQGNMVMSGSGDGVFPGLLSRPPMMPTLSSAINGSLREASEMSDCEDLPSLVDPAPAFPHHRPTRSAPSSPILQQGPGGYDDDDDDIDDDDDEEEDDDDDDDDEDHDNVAGEDIEVGDTDDTDDTRRENEEGESDDHDTVATAAATAASSGLQLAI